MSYQATTALTKIQALKKRIRVIQGGTSAGKTIAILLYLIDLAQTHEGLSISVVSETIPHLKRGARRDFLNIMHEHRFYQDGCWSRSDNIYTFKNRSYIEFFQPMTRVRLGVLGVMCYLSTSVIMSVIVPMTS